MMLEFPKPSPYVSLNGVRFNSQIPPGARILFAEFLEWSKESSSFPYDPKRLADMYSVSSFTIRKWIKILAQHNLIDLSLDPRSGLEKKFIAVKCGV